MYSTSSNLMLVPLITILKRDRLNLVSDIVYTGIHSIIELRNLVALSLAFPTTRGFSICSFHLRVNRVIAGLLRFPSLWITGNGLTAALHGTETFVILVLEAVPAVVGDQWVFAPWYGTTGPSNSDAISHDDFGACMHSSCVTILLVPIMGDSELFPLGLVMIKQ